jgi:hypothetical protein
MISPARLQTIRDCKDVSLVLFLRILDLMPGDPLICFRG